MKTTVLLQAVKTILKIPKVLICIHPIHLSYYSFLSRFLATGLFYNLPPTSSFPCNPQSSTLYPILHPLSTLDFIFFHCAICRVTSLSLFPCPFFLSIFYHLANSLKLKSKTELSSDFSADEIERTKARRKFRLHFSVISTKFSPRF